MKELLEANGIPAEQYKSISQFEEALTSAMQEKARELPVRGHVLPGVVEALTVLADDVAVIQSALTGTLRRTLMPRWRRSVWRSGLI